MKQVAVFGAGRIGRIHATNLAAQPGVQLKYVCDAVPAAAADLAQTLGAQVADVENGVCRQIRRCGRHLLSPPPPTAT